MLNFATANTFVLISVWAHITNKTLFKRPRLLSKVALINPDTDRTQKGNDLNYSNFAKLMDLSFSASQVLFSVKPLKMRHQVSWWRRNFPTQDMSLGMGNDFKTQILFCQSGRLRAFCLKSCKTVLDIWFYDLKPVFFIKFRGDIITIKAMCLFNTVWTTEICFSCRQIYGAEGEKEERHLNTFLPSPGH